MLELSAINLKVILNTPTHHLLYTTPRRHELLQWELYSSKQIKTASKTKELRQLFYNVIFN
jgi:hypothetical protein